MAYDSEEGMKIDLNLPTTKRYDLIKLLGGKCRICPEDNPAKIEIDHIYNDGDVERTKYGAGETLWGYYLRHESLAFQRLQPLCKECHRAKTWSHKNPSNYTSQISPSNHVIKMQEFLDTLKRLETDQKNPVDVRTLFRELVNSKDWITEECRHYLRRMLRDASIYESKPEYFNTV